MLVKHKEILLISYSESIQIQIQYHYSEIITYESKLGVDINLTKYITLLYVDDLNLITTDKR